MSKLLALSLSITATSANYSSLSFFLFFLLFLFVKEDGKKTGVRLREKNKQMEGWKWELFWLLMQSQQKANWPRRGTLQGAPGHQRLYIYIYMWVLVWCVCVCVQYWAVLVGRACAVPWERRTAFSHQKYTPPQRLQPRRRLYFYYIDISSRRRRAGVGREPVVAVAWRRRSRGTCFNGILVCRDGLVPALFSFIPTNHFPTVAPGQMDVGKNTKREVNCRSQALPCFDVITNGYSKRRSLVTQVISSTSPDNFSSLWPPVGTPPNPNGRPPSPPPPPGKLRLSPGAAIIFHSSIKHIAVTAPRHRNEKT